MSEPVRIAINGKMGVSRRRPDVEKVCVRCGGVFSVRPKRSRQRFCSQQCWLKIHNSPERNAEVARATIEQRAATLRARGDESGTSYRKVRGEHEHRRIAERVLKRPLTTDEIVHHVDENVRNNALTNLQVMTRSEHARLHFHGQTINRPTLEEVLQGV